MLNLNHPEIIRRPFKHHNMFYHFILNKTKLDYLCFTEEAIKLRRFLTETVAERKVPDHFFDIEGNPRCSSEPSINCFVDIVPNEWRKIIEEAIATKGDREKHYVVLKALVESSETNVVACEIPVWTVGSGYYTGHVDCLSLNQKMPQIVVNDFKPRLTVGEDGGFGQLRMYKTLIAQLLEVAFDNIQCVLFDHIAKMIAPVSDV